MKFGLTHHELGCLKRTQTKSSDHQELYGSGTMQDFLDAAEKPEDSVNLLDLPILSEVIPDVIE